MTPKSILNIHMKQEISEWIKGRNSISISSALRHRPDIIAWLTTETQQHAPKHVMEMLYIVLNGPPAYCEFGNKLQFNTYDKGYRKGCILGNKCACVGKHRMANQQLTLQSKYGVTTVNDIPGVSEKRQATMVDRYGVEYAAQSAEVKSKLATARLQHTAADKHATQVKTRNTMMQNFGVDHHMKLPEQQQKVKNTNLSLYGVEFPLQNSAINAGFHNTINTRPIEETTRIKAQTQLTFQETYGVNSASQIHLSASTLEILANKDKFISYISGQPRDKIVEQLGIHPHCLYLHAKKYDAQHLIASPSKSKFEAEVEAFLHELNINFVSNTRGIIPPKELDFYIPGLNLAIECCGLYWHSEQSSGRGRDYHHGKFKACKERGIKLITIFEDEWYGQTVKVQNRLRYITKTLKTKVYARNCKVSAIHNDVAAEFVNKHHLQGHTQASINLGLYRDTELVSVMTFSKPRFNSTHQYELIRFCSDGAVVGAASKIFKHFIKTVAPTSIISYSDNRWGWGELYEALGFSYGKSQVGYQYTNYKLRFNRMQFQKHKLLLQGYDAALTEWQIMQLKGYDRVWDCGQSSWTYQSAINTQSQFTSEN